MASRTIIPFGPQHPVLPEPVHLKISVDDEVITEAIPALGYVHRGLEKLVEIRDFNQMIQVVERVCGICSMIHAMVYCQGLEEMMQVEGRHRQLWMIVFRMLGKFIPFGAPADSSDRLRDE